MSTMPGQRVQSYPNGGQAVDMNGHYGATPAVVMTAQPHHAPQGMHQPLQVLSVTPPDDAGRWADVKAFKPDGKFRFKDQFMALARKSATYQMRQYKTNCCQIFTPFVLILALFILQVIVSSIVTSIRGKESPAIPRPPLSLPFLTQHEEDASPGCTPGPRIINEKDGTFLFANEDTAAAAAFGAVPATKSWACAAINATGFPGIGNALEMTASYSGVLGAMTLNACDMLTYKGEVIFQQAQRLSLCRQVPTYNVPKLETVPSQAEMENRILNDFPRVYAGGYVFKELRPAERRYRLAVLFNETISQARDMPLLLNLITTAIAQSLLRPDPAFRFQYPAPDTLPQLPQPRGRTLIGTKDYPSNPTPNEFDLVSLIGPFIYIYIFQLMFPVALGGIVYEKEQRLREVMKMMGLKTFVYWVVTYLFYYVIYIAAMLFMIAVACACGFRFFLVNSFGTYFIMLLIFGHTMVSAAFFLSTFFTNAQTATVGGYVYIILSGIIASQVIDQYLTSDTTSDGSLFGIQIVPSFALFRGIRILSDNVAFGWGGVQMADVNHKEVRLGEVYGFLIVEWIVFLLAAIYCEQVVPDGIGIKKHPLFLFQKETYVKKKRTDRDRDEAHRHAKAVVEGEPEDVAMERARVLKDPSIAVRAIDLEKVYPASGEVKAKTAVHCLTLGVQHGECFGFLGPNGAGKTTTINMLCGFHMPTHGTAVINGMDVLHDVDDIHAVMGVCPQHDLLWENLTGREHLRFYGRLKGLRGKLLEDSITYRLGQVSLLEAQNKAAGAFSGGMKRRLSVAIALMGNPDVVLLDEPSTGLDPASRRSLWDVINEYKKSCAMLLTTHSMEEADVLCDRLGIFSSGRLRCIGNAADLKRRFGSGFKLTTTCPVQHEAACHDFVMKLVPQAQFLNALAGTRNYELPKGSFSLRDLFAAFEANKEGLKITDWAIMDTTLEEVFLRIADIQD